MEGMELVLFNNFYKNKTVFVTGHTGFKGTWLVEWLQLLGANVIGYSMPPNTEPSHFNLLDKNYISIFGDIGNTYELEAAFIKYAPDIVFHLAAQPLVRESYQNPSLTYQTNVMGTLNVYEAVLKTHSVKAVICITTDKVYENKEWIWGYRETESLGGYDPYSSSKACVEILTDSYYKSFFQNKGIAVATARAGNVFGGGDWAKDRLIPDVMRATNEAKITTIRNPYSIRPWQHVLEPLAGYLLLGQRMLENKDFFSGAWNFAPRFSDCLSVKNILEVAQKYWSDVQYKIVIDADHLHEAKILKLDCTKAIEQLKWEPVWALEKALQKTIEWYQNYYIKRQVSTIEQIHEYIRDAQANDVIWS